MANTVILSYLIEPNQSDRFWELVEKAIPNYKEKKKWLKENGNTILVNHFSEATSI